MDQKNERINKLETANEAAKETEQVKNGQLNELALNLTRANNDMMVKMQHMEEKVRNLEYKLSKYKCIVKIFIMLTCFLLLSKWVVNASNSEKAKFLYLH